MGVSERHEMTPGDMMAATLTFDGSDPRDTTFVMTSRSVMMPTTCWRCPSTTRDPTSWSAILAAALATVSVSRIVRTRASLQSFRSASRTVATVAVPITCVFPNARMRWMPFYRPIAA